MAREATDEIIAMVELSDKGAEPGGAPASGDRKRLELGIVLAAEPDSVLLDKLTTGLAPIVVQMLKTRVAALKDGGLTILLTEQNALFAMDISDRAYVMDKAAIVYDGQVEDLKKDSRIMKEYLGV